MSNEQEKEFSICVSCGNEHQGMYCNRCGERVLLPREKTLLHYFQQLLSAFTFADTKLWLSLKTIVLKPGNYARDIASGRRVKYMRPVNLFLLCNLIYFLFPVLDTFDTTLRTQMIGLPSSELFNVEERVNERIKSEGETFETFEMVYSEVSSANSKLMLILLVLFFSVGFYLIAGWKMKYYVDHLLFAFEYGIFTLFINTIVFGYIIWAALFFFRALGLEIYTLSEFYLSGIVICTSMYFLIRGMRAYYGFNWPLTILFSLISFTWTYIVVQLYRWILFEVTFSSL